MLEHLDFRILFCVACVHHGLTEQPVTRQRSADRPLQHVALTDGHKPLKPAGALALLLRVFTPVAYVSTPAMPRHGTCLTSRCRQPVMDVEDEQALNCAALVGPFEFASWLQQSFPEPDAPPEIASIRHSTHVANSSIHGRGLFASVDLPKNTIASFYPVDCIGILEVGFLGGRGKFDLSDTYMLELAHKSVVQGTAVNVNMEHVDKDGWLAHRANDAAICEDESKAAILKYYGSSYPGANCVILPFGNAVPLMVLATLRDVKKGEELLHSYGPTYWIQEGREETLDASIRDDIGEMLIVGSLYNSSLKQVINDYEDALAGCRQEVRQGTYAAVAKAFEQLLRQEYNWPPSIPQAESDTTTRQGFGGSAARLKGKGKPARDKKKRKKT